MGTRLFENFSNETNELLVCGRESFECLMSTCDDMIGSLKGIQEELEIQINDEKDAHNSVDSSEAARIEEYVDSWYKKSMKALKGYNNGINRYSKNILNNGKYTVDLDEAYTYPLNISRFLVSQEDLATSILSGMGSSEHEVELDKVKIENHYELLKAIILHLLKIGHSDIIKYLISELQEYADVTIEQQVLDDFKLLNEIVDDIVQKHDLERVLRWFKDRKAEKQSSTIEFKFHILEFILLLHGNKEADTNSNVLSAYLYSKENFTPFLKRHLPEISPLITLLLLKSNTDNSDTNSANNHYMKQVFVEFENKIKQVFSNEVLEKNAGYSESEFIRDILENYDDIHNAQSIFANLSNEFISDYCSRMNLSSDSSLFQSILAGFINLPSFYKFNTIQKKLQTLPKASAKEEEPLSGGIEPQMKTSSDSQMEKIVAPFEYDLPFPLSDSSRFLFNYHPIFICPVSKEQLIPLSYSITYATNSSLEVTSKQSLQNPVVVLKHCKHLALKDSIWQLSKKGTEIFKCHYCYKRHKISEVTEGYFIDL